MNCIYRTTIQVNREMYHRDSLGGASMFLQLLLKGPVFLLLM